MDMSRKSMSLSRSQSKLETFEISNEVRHVNFKQRSEAGAQEGLTPPVKLATRNQKRKGTWNYVKSIISSIIFGYTNIIHQTVMKKKLAIYRSNFYIMEQSL